MSYLDRISECNEHDLTRFVPFVVGGEAMGWVRRDRLAGLESFSRLSVSTRRVELDPRADTPASRTAALAEIVDVLTARGEVTGWRGERYPIRRSFDDPAVAEIERAAVAYFGLRAWGLHVNGFVRRGDTIHMWIARRARDRQAYPGMLDNLVAGGQPANLSLADNLIKECGEEAAIPAELAATARPVGAVTYCMEQATGLKPDCMFCYDLELPEDFVPRAADGEVESFELWPIERVGEVVRTSREFKFNCNLVIIDFLLRHDLLDLAGPDRAALAQGLRRTPTD